ncbi:MULTISPECIES: SDR family NAD(P)-dependent oxidoreductase [unclassified Haladaptatus]|uniref:SDR family NAD(P)-dependent oxidoreductase n=1 Tax=unclassified Haladaptatus TaxID=2622732 RepID=UPI00209BE88F|nr:MULTISPECIES: SDR family NAD(P)-dependent oxidoreductase [unclassified Haladaptatus]MCO8247043.1 SDR family NAD(P)-dependent oxidoreductase [Haladaptatus sp. AB643]MCO8254573.1 SDR family NAD(P)-dependent oxidoreductase [Haladaptatus sp. AB618]
MNVDVYDSLDEQCALVTGANRGIGAEIAAELTALGAGVYAGARNPGEVTATDQRAVELDVTDGNTIRGAVETITDEEGRLDIVVNNAATYGPTGKLESLSDGTIETTLRTNLHGPMLVTKHALSLLTEREGGRVVTLSSGSGQFDGGIDTGHLPYGVSKAGVNAFTDALAVQYPDLLVNAVCPGWVRTEMGGSSAPRSVETGAETPVWLARFKSGGPSGRLWRDKTLVEW